MTFMTVSTIHTSHLTQRVQDLPVLLPSFTLCCGHLLRMAILLRAVLQYAILLYAILLYAMSNRYLTTHTCRLTQTHACIASGRKLKRVVTCQHDIGQPV